MSLDASLLSISNEVKNTIEKYVQYYNNYYLLKNQDIRFINEQLYKLEYTKLVLNQCFKDLESINTKVTNFARDYREQLVVAYESKDAWD